MNKILNLFMFILIIFFVFNIFMYYVSNKNIDLKKLNRNNIEQILKKKTANLPILVNDTNDIIEFNNSLENEMHDNKKRSFWDLLKK